MYRNVRFTIHQEPHRSDRLHGIKSMATVSLVKIRGANAQNLVITPLYPPWAIK